MFHWIKSYVSGWATDMCQVYPILIHPIFVMVGSALPWMQTYSRSWIDGLIFVCGYSNSRALSGTDNTQFKQSRSGWGFCVESACSHCALCTVFGFLLHTGNHTSEQFRQKLIPTWMFLDCCLKLSYLEKTRSAKHIQTGGVIMMNWTSCSRTWEQK